MWTHKWTQRQLILPTVQNPSGYSKLEHTVKRCKNLWYREFYLPLYHNGNAGKVTHMEETTTDAIQTVVVTELVTAIKKSSLAIIMSNTLKNVQQLS